MLNSPTPHLFKTLEEAFAFMPIHNVTMVTILKRKVPLNLHTPAQSHGIFVIILLIYLFFGGGISCRT